MALAYSLFLSLRFEFDVPSDAWSSFWLAYLPVLLAHLAANFLLADYTPSLSARQGLVWRLLASGFLAGLIVLSIILLPQADAFRQVPLSVVIFGSPVAGLLGRAFRVPVRRFGAISEIGASEYVLTLDLVGVLDKQSDLLQLADQYRADANSVDQRAGVLLGLAGVFVGLVADNGATTPGEMWTLWFAAVAAIASLFALVMPGGTGSLQATPGALLKSYQGNKDEASELANRLLQMRRNARRRSTALSMGAFALGGAIVGAVAVRA